MVALAAVCASAASVDTRGSVSGVRACALLSIEQAAVLSGAPGTTPAVATTSPTHCGWQDAATGTEAELDIFTVNSSDTLAEKKPSEMAGYLLCSPGGVKTVKQTGEVGFYCGSSSMPANLVIQKGTVQLHLEGTTRTSYTTCIEDATFVFKELAEK